jgi:tetratricopeptide (TPR) repeat protein
MMSSPPSFFCAFARLTGGRQLVLVWLVLLFVSGCAGYARRLEGARTSVYGGDYEAALSTVDALVLGGESGRRSQANDLPLLLLERASLYQALGMHEQAVADFAEADGMLETLDLTPDTIGDVAEYLYSGSASLYRAPIYEKLMINVSALASYLAMNDLQGARVEVRRIEVIADYFAQRERTESHPALASAWYMAGIASELVGDRQSALRFYLDAWQIEALPGLAESLVRMAENTPFASNEAVLRARQSLGLRPDDAAPARPEGEIISIVMTGLPPIRQAVNLPIGLAVAAIRADASYGLSAEQESRLARAMAEDILTFVNFPELVLHANPINSVGVVIDGRTASAGLMADVERFAVAEWERQRPAIAVAAITRALLRIGARELIQGATRAADSGNGVAQTIGFIASLAAQGAMTAADRPDTRTWTFMPAYIWMERRAVTPGDHAVTLIGHNNVLDRSANMTVTVPASGAGIAVARFLE